MPIWTLYVCGIIIIWKSRSEKKSSRADVHQLFVPFGVVKAEKERLELDRISISCICHLKLSWTLFFHPQGEVSFSLSWGCQIHLCIYFLKAILKSSIKRHPVNIIKSLIVWFIMLQIWTRCCKSASGARQGNSLREKSLETGEWVPHLHRAVTNCCHVWMWPQVTRYSDFSPKAWAIEMPSLLPSN